MLDCQFFCIYITLENFFWDFFFSFNINIKFVCSWDSQLENAFEHNDTHLTHQTRCKWINTEEK